MLHDRTMQTKADLKSVVNAVYVSSAEPQHTMMKMDACESHVYVWECNQCMLFLLCHAPAAEVPTAS